MPTLVFLVGAGAEINTGATDFLCREDFGTLSDEFRGRRELDFSSVYDVAFATRAELGYYITPCFALFAGFTYNHSDASEVTFDDDVTITDPVHVRMAIGEYTAYAGRGGFKLYTPESWTDWTGLPFRSYVTYSAGGKYVEGIGVGLHFIEPQETIDYSYNYDLYKDSWVFTTDMQLGIEYKLGCCTSIGFEAGVGYDSKLGRRHEREVTTNTDGNETNLVVTTDDDRDRDEDGADRLYIPLTLFAKVRF